MVSTLKKTVSVLSSENDDKIQPDFDHKDWGGIKNWRGCHKIMAWGWHPGLGKGERGNKPEAVVWEGSGEFGLPHLWNEYQITADKQTLQTLQKTNHAALRYVNIT